MNSRTRTVAIILVLLSITAIPAAVAQQEAGGNGSESTPGETDAPADDEEFTRLSVRVDDGYPDLKPGESETVTVTVRNLDDEEVTLDPTIEYPPQMPEPLPEEWLEFDEDDLTVAPDEEAEFDVTVSVPEDADLRRYNGMIAVTDERVAHPGQPARPLHAATLGVNVYEDPTVHVVSQTFLHGQIEAGESATAEVVVENTGDEAVPLNPEVGSDQRVRTSPAADGVLDPSWISIDAPGEVAPGDRATVEVTVSPPADADLGNYRTDLELGLRDPARPEGDDYWQRISMDVNVWSQPDEAYDRAFDVSDDADAVELRLTQQRGYGSTAFEGDAEPGTFDVTFEGPDGERITPERVEVADRGSVDLTGDARGSAVDDGYADGTAAREYVYRVEDPAAGEWTVEIEPENTIGFGYEIVREEAAD